MAGAGPHILTFYVIRLAKPLLDLDPPLRLDLERDFDGRAPLPGEGGGAGTTGGAGRGGAGTTSATGSKPGAGGGRFAGRIDAGDPLAALGLRGPLGLPPSFGPVYLGEQFSCLVSLACISGPAGAGAAAVAVRAELQTEDGRALLHDTGGAPLPMLHPGGRSDVILRHDVRALGPHTLVCTAAYTVAVSGERKQLPAYFKFTAAPPLAVRTKVRSVPPPAVAAAGGERSAGAPAGGSVLVEATIDNLKAGPLCLEPPRFDAAPGLVAVWVGCGGGGGSKGAPTPAPLPIPPDGASSFVFAVSPADPAATPMPPPGAPLGRLDLRWAAGSMGGPGRLQTQDVCAAPAAARAVALTAVSLPASAPLATPFPVTLLISSALDVPVGPLRLEPAGADFPGAGEEGEEGGPPPPPAPSSVVFLHGDARPGVPGSADGGLLPPEGTATLTVSLVALAPGIHRLPALRLVDGGDGRVLDVLAGWVRVSEGENY
jgi:hypothetical protein